MGRIMEVASEHKVCWTPWNLVRVQVGLANICLHLKSTPQLSRGRDGRQSEI